MLGSTPVAYIGRANWVDKYGKNEFASGVIDEYKIYGKALTEDEVKSEYNRIANSISSNAWENIKENPRVIFADYFNDGTATPSKGAVTENGTIAYSSGPDGSKALRLNTGANYLQIFDENGVSPLKDKNEVAIAFKVSTDDITKTSWYMYAATDDTSAKKDPRKYIAALNIGSKLTLERYSNINYTANMAKTAAQNSFSDVVILLNDTKTEIYVDGIKKAEKQESGTLEDILGSNPITYIGYGAWWGEYTNGITMDNIEIYDTAPIIDLGDTTHLENNLSLPTYTDKEGISIEWTTSDSSVITNTGVISRPKTGKKSATLTAKIKMGNVSLTREFPVAVYGTDNPYDIGITVTSEKGVDIQDNMYGLFFEDISYSADGGLSAEKIENRNFEQIFQSDWKHGTTATTYKNPSFAWTVEGNVTFPTEGDDIYMPKSNKNPTYAHLTGTKLSNKAYEGIYAKSGDKLNISFYAKSDSFNGSISAGIDGQNVTVVPTGALTNEWTKYTAQLTVTSDVRYKSFDVILSESGTIDIDMISCIPNDAVCGVFRKDLAEKLKDLNPGFLRFPGGCIIEGLDLANRYQWKKSVGPADERTQNWTRWGGSGSDIAESYNQTLAIGYFEYLELCEYLECDPIPVLNVGLSCEYNSPKETVPVYASQVEGDSGVIVNGIAYSTGFYQYIQDALDLIEFCNGTDESNEWVALRKSMGHNEPFNLTMLGIGNEQWQIKGNQWHERYEAFESVIHTSYPEIKLISTSGPSSDDRAPDWDFSNAWNWIREKKAENDSFTYATDEHYYNSADWFFENTDRYDNYDRNAKVFAGEYAANGEYGNTIYSALAEAAAMTGFERNADVVYMASYAPLFCREGHTCWSPNMIWFDDATSYGKPDYYEQQMFMQNSGDYTIKSEMEKLDSENYYQSVSFDEKSGDVIIKVVNPLESNAILNVDLSAVDKRYTLTGKTDVILLTSDNKTDTNTVAEPEKVKPVKSEINNSSSVKYSLPSLSFAIFRVHTKTTVSEKASLELTVSAQADTISYTAETNTKQGTLYVALYDDDGVLQSVKMNNPESVFENIESGNYEVKAFLWNDMTPMCESKHKEIEVGEVEFSGYVNLSKSVLGNPITGFDEKGNMIYAGDPAPMVDGDTVYLYVGHDVASGSSYSMPNWLLYSSKNLIEWNYEGVVMEENTETISWANGNSSAWASQAIKYGDKYYFYYCTTGKTEISGGHHCVGVAVSDSPKGPFTDIGKPLVNGYVLGIDTGKEGWYNIDPTVWIDKDDYGTEHIYLNWGNTYNVTCELNSDMVSVKDINGDGEITKDDFVTSEFLNFEQNGSTEDYREASWLYRRKDEKGIYYGKYYMFFANGWRESYSYAVTDDPMSGKWDYKGSFMPPNATANTSHGGVFDFNGKTYYIYHNGSLPGGSGYRRVANIQEVVFNDDGSIDELTELSTGISGWATAIISANGKYIGHEEFRNTKDDNDYPIIKNLTAGDDEGYNTQWEIKLGKANKNKKEYVSLQSVNKPGLYICESNGNVILTQDANNTTSRAMTFITHNALNGNSQMVSFESLTKKGYYLTVSESRITLTDGTDINNASFNFDSEMAEITDIPISEIVEDEIITNGGFENNLLETGGWTFPNTGGWYNESDTVAESTTLEKYSGECSVKLQKATIGQRMPLDDGVTYTVSLYVKGETSGTVNIGFYDGTEAWPASNPVFTKSVTVTNEWQKAEIEFECEVSKDYVFCIDTWDGATVYVDDVLINTK